MGKTLCIRAKPNFVFNYYSVNQETTPGSTYPVTGEPYWAKASSECPEVTFKSHLYVFFNVYVVLFIFPRIYRWGYLILFLVRKGVMACHPE